MVTTSDNRHRIAVFIDASNVWAAQKSKGKMFDYIKLLTYLNKRFAPCVIDAYFYTAYPANNTRTYSLDGKHKFYTFLEKNLGFTVRKKVLKRITVHGEDGDYVEEKGNMDVEITIDAMHFRDKFVTAIFFTGDSDFLPLISYLRNSGKKCFIFSSKNNVSHELKTGGDGYTDILEIGDDIWGRDLAHRPSKSV